MQTLEQRPARRAETGWLRRLMMGATPPFRSIDALARAALAERGWPPEAKLQSRSLAAIFGKLDRGQELEWLSSRPAVQHLLAKVLGASLAEVEAAVQTGVEHEEALGRVSLDELPAARALDLLSESLFPGIPEAVLVPGSWKRLWWVASAGDGRELVGKWLSVRGLARVVQTETWSQARSALPAAGIVFVDLYSYPESERNAECDRIVSSLSEFYPRLKICVAAPYEPGSHATRRRDGFRVIRSPEVFPLLEEIVSWVEGRLPSGGRFAREPALEWLRNEPTAQLLGDSVGSVLGLCALLDEFGVHSMRGKSPGELAHVFFRSKMSQLSQEESARSWLHKHGFEVCLGIGRRWLTDPGEPWDCPRSFEQWMLAIPIEYQHSVDLEWMKLALTEAGTSIRPSDLDRAARRISPGAFQIVRGLERSKLLQSGPQGTLRIVPRWFGSAVFSEALRSLVRGSPFEWGEALLSPASATKVMGALWDRAERGLDWVENLLELEADENPAHVAALEATFRVVGLSLLKNPDALSAELLEALLDEQLRLVIELDGLPTPRIDYADLETRPGESSRPPLTHPGLWYLAALAISEQLPAQSGAQHPLLRPWTRAAPDPEQGRLFDVLIAGLAASPASFWSHAAFLIADRLRAAIGSTNVEGRCHPLEQPGLIVDEVDHGVLVWDSLVDLHRVPHAALALVDLARVRDLDFGRVTEAIWSAWGEAGCPRSGADFLLSDPEFARRLWPHLPKKLMQEVLRSVTKLPVELFGDEQWEAYLESAKGLKILPDASDVVLAIPCHFIQPAARGGLLDTISEPVLERLWQRCASAVLEAAVELVRSGHPAAGCRLLCAAPAKFTGELVQSLKASVAFFELPRLMLDGLRRNLHLRIARRDPEWRDAYRLLLELEQGLSPLNHL